MLYALYSEPVLYPSGTDFRTRIPTLKRLDCTVAGSSGNDGEGVDCDDTRPVLGAALLWGAGEKKEVMAGWEPA